MGREKGRRKKMERSRVRYEARGAVMQHSISYVSRANRLLSFVVIREKI